MSGFRSVRWMRTINLVAQAILVLTLCAGLNYIAFNHSLRWDLTSRNKFSLSPETLANLKDIEQPVRIVVTLVENENVPQVAAALPDIRGLLREYAYATQNNVDPGRRDGRITVEYVDVYARNRDAVALGVTEPNVVTFFCGDRSRIVKLEDIYTIDSKGGLTAFRGEQAFTTAIIDVEKTQKKVYFLSGHGEARVDDTKELGVSRLADILRQRNFAVETININSARGVPTDASVLVAVILRPQPFEPVVQEKLRQYLTSTAQNGRLILFIPPGVEVGDLGLRSLLEDWGIWTDNVLVQDANPGTVTPEGHLLVSAVGEHAITQTLAEIKNNFPRVGAARAVRPDVGGNKLSGLKVTTLAMTSEQGWGKRNPGSGRLEFVPGVDLRGLANLDPSKRIGLAVASERVRPRENLPFSVASGRLVVFGSVDFTTNRWIDDVTGNQNIVLNAVSWATGRDNWINIPPRPVERFQLTVSQRDLTRLRYSLLLILPGAAALLGIFVYWTRRT